MESTLQLILLIAIFLTIASSVAGYFVGLITEKGSLASKVLIGIVLLLVVGLMVGTRSLTEKIGPVITNVAGLISAAILFGLGGGILIGRRKRHNQPFIAGMVLGVMSVLCLWAISATTQNVVKTAKEFGIGQKRENYEPEKNKDCPENLKSLYLAFSSYVQDWDALPPVENWLENEEIVSKVTQNEWLHCPEVSDRKDDKFGYAYNSSLAGKKLEGKKLTEIPDAAKTPLLYDSTELGKNAHDKISTLPKPGRHSGKNNILYCDGHVEAVSP